MLVLRKEILPIKHKRTYSRLKALPSKLLKRAHVFSSYFSQHFLLLQFSFWCFRYSVLIFTKGGHYLLKCHERALDINNTQTRYLITPKTP